MNFLKGIFMIIFMTGIILIIGYYILNGQTSKNKIVYKYIPRTVEEDEKSPIYVSEIFKTMFTQPSVWIDSINLDKKRANEKIGEYFITQM